MLGRDQWEADLHFEFTNAFGCPNGVYCYDDFFLTVIWSVCYFLIIPVMIMLLILYRVGYFLAKYWTPEELEKASFLVPFYMVGVGMTVLPIFVPLFAILTPLAYIYRILHFLYVNFYVCCAN